MTAGVSKLVNAGSYNLVWFFNGSDRASQWGEGTFVSVFEQCRISRRNAWVFVGYTRMVRVDGPIPLDPQSVGRTPLITSNDPVWIPAAAQSPAIAPGSKSVWAFGLPDTFTRGAQLRLRVSSLPIRTSGAASRSWTFHVRVGPAPAIASASTLEASCPTSDGGQFETAVGTSWLATESTCESLPEGLHRLVQNDKVARYVVLVRVRVCLNRAL